MYSVTSSLRHKLKSLNLWVSEGERMQMITAGWSLHDLAVKTPFFSGLPPETSNYTFRRSHESELVSDMLLCQTENISMTGGRK